MKNAIEMSSGAMLCMPSIVQIGSDILKYIGGSVFLFHFCHLCSIQKR
jgi:hypothetical protein